MGRISEEIKQKAIFYTDRLDAYNLIPHRRIVRKGGTNNIEQLFLTLRNDNPRFARKLSDSLKIFRNAR